MPRVLTVSRQPTVIGGSLGQGNFDLSTALNFQQITCRMGPGLRRLMFGVKNLEEVKGDSVVDLRKVDNRLVASDMSKLGGIVMCFLQDA